MCTLTWLKEASTYEVFFNRDELLTRQEENPPSYHNQGDVQFLAPVDPQGQGTWVGVNDRGVTLCLTNLYPSHRSQGIHYKSRGQLLWSLLGFESLKDVVDQIKNMALQDYLGFRIVGFSLMENVCIIQFNEGGLNINTNANGLYPVTSSSFHSQDVQNGRIRYFEETVGRNKKLNPQMLDIFHNSTHPQLGPYSVCMKRDDACTKSYSRVFVSQDNITFD